MSSFHLLYLVCAVALVPANSSAGTTSNGREMSGQVIFSFSTDGNRSFILSGPHGGAFVRQMDDNKPERYHEGEVVTIAEWSTTNLNTGTALCPRKIIRNGKRPLPECLPAIPERISSGDYDYRLIRIDGTIIDAFKDEIDPRWTWILLRSHNTTIPLTFQDRKPEREDLRRFVDAEVSIDGCCMPIHKGHRTYMSSIVQFHDLTDVRVIKPAETIDPFGVPELDRQKDIAALHRRRLSGRVLATWDGNRLFLENSKGPAIQIRLRRGQSLPAVGTFVDVVGFTETDNFFIKLIQAGWRQGQDRADVANEPIAVNPIKITHASSGAPQIMTEYNGRLIRIRGHVRNIPQDPSLEKLNLDCNGQMVPVDVTAIADAVGRLQPGSLVEICGACLMDFISEMSGTGFPRISGFTLITRSDSDVKVLSSPPWWTPLHLIIAIGILVFALVGILIWNLSLRIISERRGRELFKSQIAEITAALRVDERTRLAVELHDHLSQNLTAVSYQLSSGISCLDFDDASTRRFLRTADRMLLSCRTELRRCLYDLRSEALEETDFAKAIRLTLQTVADRIDLAIQFNVPRRKVSDSTAHTVLSIIRELASNAVQHGQATRLLIVGDVQNGVLEFSVCDNGKGFDVSHHLSVQDGHFGLEGIHDRVERIGGKLDLTSSSDSGTKAVITIPINQHTEN